MISSGHYQIPSGHYQVPPSSFTEPALDHLEIHPEKIQICSKLGEGQFGTVHVAKVMIDAVWDRLLESMKDDTEEYVVAAVKVLKGMLINIIVIINQ